MNPAVELRDTGAAGTAAALRLEQRTELNRVYFEYENDFAPILDERIQRAVTVRDYGDGLVEVGYAPVSHARDDRPKLDVPQSELFSEEDNQKRVERNLSRSVRRSRAQVRRKCMAGELDHLLTLTYRQNVKSPSKGFSDFKRFVRLVRANQGEFRYVCVHEFQKRGAVHLHVAVRGFQNVRMLRSLWLRVVGEGNIDVRAPQVKGSARWQRAKLAGYLTKYITKEVSSLNARQRYRVSEGIDIPGETRVFMFPKFVDFVAEVFDSLGVSCSFHWKANDGPFGWACSW